MLFQVLRLLADDPVGRDAAPTLPGTAALRPMCHSGSHNTARDSAASATMSRDERDVVYRLRCLRFLALLDASATLLPRGDTRT
jgi:hypothetical protein